MAYPILSGLTVMDVVRDPRVEARAFSERPTLGYNCLAPVGASGGEIVLSGNSASGRKGMLLVSEASGGETALSGNVAI